MGVMISISGAIAGKLNQNEFGHFLPLYCREQWHLPTDLAYLIASIA
jgi:hypothetical protein